MTNRQKFIVALEKRGAKRMVDTRRYIVYRWKDTNFYIGKAGALRIGATVTGSIPVSDGSKARLLAEIITNS